MGDFVRVAGKDEIPPGACRSVDVSGTPVAIYNVAGTFHATQDTCLHVGGPLGEGFLEGAQITCPWHGWQYDVKSGACVTNPSARLQTFEVQVEGNDVKVRLP